MNDTKVKIDVELNSLKDLQKALKAAKDEMVGLEAGSDAFNQAANKAGELKHQIDEINQSVRGASSDFGDMLGNVAKAGAGITGAFQAAQGALNLFGVESEDVTKAIEKMQSMMALTQGLAAIDQGIKSFRKFTTAVTSGSSKIKVALTSTGLGAIAVVLGSIIANWDEFTKAIGLSEQQMSKFGEVASGVANVVLKSTGKIAKAFSKVIKGDFSGAWDEIKQGWDFQEMYAEGVQKKITENEKKELEKRKAEFQKYVDKKNEQLDTERSKAEATIEDEQKRNEELIRIETERLKLYKEGTKEYYDQLKEIQDLEKSEADRQQKIADEKQKQIDKDNEQKQRELDKIKNRTQAIKDSYRDELQVVNDTEQEKLNAIQTALDKQLISQQEFENLKTQIVAEAEEKRKAISDKAFEDSENAMSQTLRAINQVGQIAFGALGDTLGAFADMQDTTTKEGFEKQKKLQIASATMNMLGGVLSAWTSAMNPANSWMTIWGQVAAGIAQTTATVAMGIAQINQIKKQTFGGNSASSASVSATIRPAAALSAPVQYTQDIQGAELTSAIKDTRVYVTETDITETQRKVDLAETESTF